MKLIRARILGFCMGVRRAVEMADEAINAASAGSGIYTIGPLIHNPQVLDSLSGRGVTILEEANISETLPLGATVIIRAHGISPGTEHIIRERGAHIIDATCPRVKASQNTAFALAEQGYTIFLAGEKNHAEIKAIYGYVLKAASRVSARDDTEYCIIAGNHEEADLAAHELRDAVDRNKLPVKTALIGQSTISEDEYLSIAEAIKRYFPHLEIKDTICGATRDRQNALRELCSVVDAVIIAGGKESANTRRLLSIARSCGKKAWLAETASELPKEILQLPEAVDEKTIGLSAGASTPDSVIDEIEQALV